MNKNLYEQISNYVPYDEKEALDKEVMLKFISSTEDVLTRENQIAHMTASAWITNKNRDKILMIYHNIYDSWACIFSSQSASSIAERAILSVLVSFRFSNISEYHSYALSPSIYTMFSL